MEFEWSGYADVKKKAKNKRDTGRKKQSREESKEAGASGTRVKHFTKVDGTRVKSNTQLGRGAQKHVPTPRSHFLSQSDVSVQQHPVEPLWHDDGDGKSCVTYCFKVVVNTIQKSIFSFHYV